MRSDEASGAILKVSRISSIDAALAVPIALTLTGFIVAGTLFIRAIYIQYPLVLGDEALYALHSKFLNDPRFVPVLPNILYFWVYHLTSWFGSNHAVMAKLLNAIFFGLVLIPIYSTASRFLSRPGAYLFAVVVALSPISSYSVYEMPESMYFFIFWVLVYVVVVDVPRSLVRGGFYGGLALAALSAVKPHGLVLTATIPLVLVSLYLAQSEETTLGQFFRAFLIYLAAFVVARMVISLVVRGDPFSSLVGHFYARFLPYAPAAARPIGRAGTWYAIGGHLGWVLILFWPTALMTLWPATSCERGSRFGANYEALLVFSFASLAALILMTAKFTADLDVAEQICRLHGRYYDFMFGPLALLFLARTRAGSPAPRWPRLFGTIMVGGACIATVLAVIVCRDFCPNLVDFPEVLIPSKMRLGLALTIAGCIGSAVGLAFFGLTFGRWVYASFLATVALTTSVAVFVGQYRAIAQPHNEDLAAIAVRNLIPDQIDDGIILARSDTPGSYRAMFQLYSLSPRKILKRDTVAAEDIPPGKKWALLLDPYTIEVPHNSVLHGKGFEFVQLQAQGGIASDPTNLSPSSSRNIRAGNYQAK